MRFPGLFLILSEFQQVEFLKFLVLPLKVHRRGKDLPCLRRYNINENADIITKVQDSFSEAHLNAYFSKPVLAFLFAWFSTNEVARAMAWAEWEK